MQTKAQGSTAARHAAHRCQTEVAALQSARAEVQSEIADIASSQAEANQSLSEQLVPDLDPEAFDHLAAQLGADHLVGRIAALEQKRAEFEQRRRAIAQEPEFRDRDALTNPHTGTLTLAIRAARAEVEGLELALHRFGDKRFQWLLERAAQEPKKRNPFQQFWRGVTLGPVRESHTRDQMCEHLGYENFEDCVAAYQSLRQDHREAERELQAQTAAWKSVFSQIEAFDTLSRWVDDFEEEALVPLRLEVCTVLEGVDLLLVRRRLLDDGLPQEAQRTLSKAIALKLQGKHLECILRSLLERIGARQHRLVHLRQLQRAWAQEPYEILEEDDDLKLVESVEKEKRDFGRELEWLRSLAKQIGWYEQYEDYDDALNDDPDFEPTGVLLGDVAEAVPESFWRAVFEG